MQRLRKILTTAMAHRRWPWALMAIIAVLYGPTLDDGWLADDHYHRAALTGALPGEPVPAWNLFDFGRLEEANSRLLMELGLFPWWSASDARLSFLRPISGLSHGFDYLVWPDSPELMHAHSILWFMAAGALAWIFFRRLLEPWVAGLAALILVLDQGFALAVGWIANRNAVLALVFGLGALLAHDRWRRQGYKSGAWLGPLCLLVAVLSNEGAIAVGAYLVAYAAFLDPTPRRWWALAPSTAVGLLWTGAYKIFDYGIRGSGIYIDPASEPLRFLLAATERLPLLLWGQWAFPGPELQMLLAPTWNLAFVVLAALLGLALLPLLWPLRRVPACRFFAVGMVLSLLPACSTFPSNRLLFFSSLGAAGLLACLFAHCWHSEARRWRRAVAVALAGLHLVLAPATLGLTLGGLGRLDTLIRSAAKGIEQADIQPGQTLVLADTPTSFIVAFMTVMRSLDGQQLPDSVILLASGLYGSEMTRTADNEIVVRPVGGYLPGVEAGSGDASEDLAPIDLSRALLILDRLYRAAPFSLGERIELPAATIEISEVSGEGQALEATFRFRESLDHQDYRWLCWHQRSFRECAVPSVGTVMERPAVIKQ